MNVELMKDSHLHLQHRREAELNISGRVRSCNQGKVVTNLGQLAPVDNALDELGAGFTSRLS